VPPVEGFFMVLLPVQRVEHLVNKAAKQTFAWGKAAVGDVAMKKVFNQGPAGTPTR
jgi:hypothetical protein